MRMINSSEKKDIHSQLIDRGIRHAYPFYVIRYHHLY